jgi:Rieske 2Fe-2S family protein
MTRFLKTTEVGTGGARALPGEFYTSPEIFRQECERIFLRRWLCAGREEQVTQHGDFFVRSIGSESVVVLRDRAGAVRALYNVCRHRGARLFEPAHGRLPHTIRCPYHAWTYALDGRLLGAPSMEGVEGFDPADYPLHAIPLATWEGFIFVCLAEEPEPFERAYAPLLGRFARYNLPALRAARRIDYDVRANWKLVVENYSECYHCPTAHPALARLTPSDSGENDLVDGPFLGGFMTVAHGDGLTESGRACSIPVGALPGEDLGRVYYYTIFPHVLLCLHRDYVMVHTLWPESPGRTRIECEWLFHPDAAAHPGFDPDDGVRFWDTTNRQDWQLCESSQQGVGSRAYAPGPYSPRESLSAAFDREVLEALGEDRSTGSRRRAGAAEPEGQTGG